MLIFHSYVSLPEDKSWFEFGFTLPGSLGLNGGPTYAKEQVMDKDFEPGARRHDTQHIAGFNLWQVDGGAFVPTSTAVADFGHSFAHFAPFKKITCNTDSAALWWNILR